MIYRAYDCGIYGNAREPVTTVWFDASSRKDAGERLTALLALTWQVEPEQVFVGNVDDEVEMELNSVQDKTARDRRWIESGSHGDLPSYYVGPTLVFLRYSERKRLAAAAVAAKQHAQEIVGLLSDKAAGLMAGSRAVEDAAYEIEQYRAFASSAWLSEPDA